MSARNSIMSSAEKAKETKLKKQHSLGSNNHNTVQKKESAAKDKEKDAADDNSSASDDKFKQFEGDGVIFKTKLIGSELVMESRGDKMCQNSIQRLKAIIKGQKAHKKRIVMKISYDGVKIYDEKTNELLYHHEVPQISFISSDDTDSRTFGYVCDVPNKAHQFVCFKTSGPALQVMSVISSLFEAVLERKKSAEQEGSDNNNSSTSSNKNSSQQSDSMLDDQLIIQDNSTTTSPEKETSSATSGDSSKAPQESATEELTKQLGHTLSFSPPMNLFDRSDSGIIDSPSTTLNEWSIPPPPPPHSFKQNAQHQESNQQQRDQRQQSVTVTDRPSLLSLNSSSPITTSSMTKMGAPAGALLAGNRILPGSSSHQNRSLIYNHSSVSLNDAALSNRPSFVSPSGMGSQNESTDRYAVFNDIDNLPSIFESTSSLGSKTNLSNVGQANGAMGAPVVVAAQNSSNLASAFDAPFAGPPAPITKSLHAGGSSSSAYSFDNPSNGGANSDSMFFSAQRQTPTSPTMVSASGDPFQSADQQSAQQQHQQYQAQQYRPQQQYQQQHQQHYSNPQGPTPTPSMMVPINPGPSSSFAFGPHSGDNMIVGSAPMGGHQMSAHARFSSSMVAGLHQRLGSSAASIQSVGSAGALSRQTNPFDDDFFS